MNDGIKNRVRNTVLREISKTRPLVGAELVMRVAKAHHVEPVDVSRQIRIMLEKGELSVGRNLRLVLPDEEKAAG